MTSETDKQLTEKMKKAAKTLDMHILDHMIFTSEGFYSIADNCFD